MPRIRTGSIVRLRRRVQPTGPRQLTRVRAFLPGIPGGVWLDDALLDSRGWNVSDLELAPTTLAQQRRSRVL